MKKPKLQYAERFQVEMIVAAVDDLLDPDHQVRAVMAYVEGMNLDPILAKIKSFDGGKGAPAIDPVILMALWLYATLEGVGSARRLTRLTTEHIAYRWICGGVTVNYHTLSDFRAGHGAELGEILAQGVTALVEAGVASLDRLAQDGMRVRASAGSSSFRRGKTLEKKLEEARAYIKELEEESDGESDKRSARQQAAQERAAREREERIEAAREEVKKVSERRTNKTKSEARASTTDPQARNMKMPDGGFRPGYNVEFATDAESHVIVGVHVVNTTDMGQMAPMLDEIREQYGRLPKELLADGGFAKHDDIEKISKEPYGVVPYVPPREARLKERNCYEPRAKDSEVIAKWRARMGTEEAQAIYKLRAQTAELPNAHARNRGLYQFLVRGIEKVKAVALWYALAHNLKRTLTLLAEPQGTT